MVTCRKVRYRHRIDAKIAMASTQRARGSNRDESRIYWCVDCLAYHLTSKR